MNESLIFALAIRFILVTAGLYNLRLAFGEYNSHRDARGLRGYVSALTMMAGVIALAASSPAIRAEWPQLTTLWIVMASAGVFGFIAGLLFSCYAWRAGR